MYRHYVYGQKVIIRTDHKLLKWLKDKKHRNSRLRRFAINLQDYDYNLEYVKGKDSTCADFLSRKDDQDKLLILNTENLTPPIFRKNFRPAVALLDTNLTAPNIHPPAASPLKEIDGDVNALTQAMKKRPSVNPHSLIPYRWPPITHHLRTKP
uniref:Reverse transcriptase RNase H-like domain-containing protein n=1 Tax=Romanomermis culicivorax TaxID=13658 RepID=A0A915IJF0_ROMCU